MKPFKGQNYAIEELVNNYIKVKNNKVKEKIIEFKSPTGSGKTFIIASFINEIRKKFSKNNNYIFIIGTLSDAELPKQFEKKLIEYKENSGYEYSTPKLIIAPSSRNAKKDQEAHISTNEEILIFGTSVFGGKRIYSEHNEIDKFLHDAKIRDKRIIYIRDEAHKGTTKLKGSSLKEEEKITDAAKFVIHMTATPNGSYKQVVLNEEDLIDTENNKSLLKNELVMNCFKHVNLKNNEDIDSFKLLDIALKKFIEVKNKYPDNINPAALVQVSNSSGLKDEQEEFNNFINKLTKIIERKGLNWAIYFGDQKSTNSRIEKLNLDAISKVDSDIDVIIFKVGPATGWDIPRANTLIQIREIFSEKLNIQTVGRIKRNPISNLDINKVVNKYYIYSNNKDLRETSDLYKYELQNKYFEKKFYKIYLKIDKRKIKNAIEETKKSFLAALFNKSNEVITKYELDEFSNKFKRNVEKDINEIFDGGTITYQKLKYRDSVNEKQFNLVFNEIKNSIKLHIENQDKLNLLNENLKEIILFVAREMVKKLDNKFTMDQIIFLILIDYMNILKNIFMKATKEMANYEYSIKKDVKMTKEYLIWVNRGNNSTREKILSNFEDIKNIYPYRNTLEKERYKQALDSNPEKEFMDMFISSYFKDENESKLELFVKNPLHGNKVFMEYGKDGIKARMYIDFILKKEDSNRKDEKYLMIEIKGKDDYDEIKTNQIRQAFADWKQQINVVKNDNLSFMIIYMPKWEKNDLTDEEMKEKFKTKEIRMIINGEIINNSDDHDYLNGEFVFNKIKEIILN